MIVYLITNIVNGKLYVGKTKLTLDERWKGHIYDARYGSKNAIHRAIRKYGQGSFTREVICTGKTEEELFELEKLWIATLGTYTIPEVGYNMTPGGDSGPDMTGTKRSEEWKVQASKRQLGVAHRGTGWSQPSSTRKAISEAAKKQWAARKSKGLVGRLDTNPEEVRQRLVASMIGNTRASGNKGKPKSEQHKQRISQGHLRRNSQT